jgi:hypothetical protein
LGSGLTRVGVGARAHHPAGGGEADLVAVHVAIEGGTNGFDPAANVEQQIGPTRGCQIGEPIGERLEQPIEHRLGRCPRVTRRAVPALSLFFGVIRQLPSL